MDLLIVEPLEPEVVQWLDVRFRIRYAPRLALEPLALAAWRWPTCGP